MKKMLRLNNSGSSLIVAIFMLVVFGFLGVSLVSMLTTNTVGSSEEVLSVQALFMAESGAEIAITECVQNGSCGDEIYQFDNGKSAEVTYDAPLVLDGVTVRTIQSKGIVLNAQRSIRIKFK